METDIRFKSSLRCIVKHCQRGWEGEAKLIIKFLISNPFKAPELCE